MNIVNENVPSHLKCPVCLNIPTEKILQCRRGHVLCQRCHSELINCPKCHSLLNKDGEEIRCMVLEEMLDELKLDCPFKASGCNKILDRKSVQSHVQLCWFGLRAKPEVRSTNLCKLMGYKNCSFFIKKKSRSAEIIQHLVQHHHCTVLDGNSFSMKYMLTPQMLTGFWPNPKFESYSWKPIIIELKHDGRTFMIVTILDLKNQAVCWLPFSFPIDDFGTGNPIVPAPVSQNQFSFEFAVSTENNAVEDNNNISTWKWSISPFDIHNADQLLSKFYPFRIPLSCLINEDESVLGICKVIVMHFKIKKEDFILHLHQMPTSIPTNGNFLVAGSYELTPLREVGIYVCNVKQSYFWVEQL